MLHLRIERNFLLAYVSSWEFQSFIFFLFLQLIISDLMEDLMILWWIGQVVAGLKKFVHEYELERRKVCVILNLKPAKLAGQVSEAMILAGSVPTPDGSEIVKVQSYPYPCPLIPHLILFVWMTFLQLMFVLSCLAL